MGRYNFALNGASHKHQIVSSNNVITYRSINMASNTRTADGNFKNEEEGRIQIDPDVGIWVAVTI